MGWEGESSTAISLLWTSKKWMMCLGLGLHALSRDAIFRTIQKQLEPNDDLEDELRWAGGRSRGQCPHTAVMGAARRTYALDVDER